MAQSPEKIPPGAAPPPLPRDEGAADAGDVNEAEVERLRQQVRSLKGQLAQREQTSSPGRARRGGVRTVFAVVLVVLGSLFSLSAGLALFARNQVLNTDRYVAEVGPLSKDPAISSALATVVTNQLFSQVNVENELKKILPSRLDVLAAPLAGTIRSSTTAAAEKVIRSDQFNRVWIQMNRRMHSAVVSVLTGKSGSTVSADKNGTVKLDLHQLAVNVVKQLDSQGITVFDKVPVNAIGGQVTLFTAPGLVKAQRVTNLLNDLAIFLPILALVCFAGAIAVARRHRRALIWSALGLASAMAILTIALGLVRSYVISASEGHAFTPAAMESLLDALLQGFIDALRIIFIVGLLAALTAWLAGSSRPARAIRRAVGRAWNWISRGLGHRRFDFGHATRWLQASSGYIQGGLLVAGAIVLIWWGSPGLGGALLVIVITAALVLLIRILFGRTSRDGSTPEGPQTSAPRPDVPAEPHTPVDRSTGTKPSALDSPDHDGSLETPAPRQGH